MMTPADSGRLALRALSSLLYFGALSALIGAIIAIPAKGAGFPLEYLEHTPFDSFVVPGLILGFVVGGTQLLAALAVRAHRSEGMLLSAVAGFGMLIWIFSELALIGHYHWLQTVYFILGTLELIFVFALLGIRPSVVAPLGEPSRSPEQGGVNRSPHV